MNTENKTIRDIRYAFHFIFFLLIELLREVNKIGIKVNDKHNQYSDFFRDENRLKFIFDYIRNLGLAALVSAVGLQLIVGERVFKIPFLGFILGVIISFAGMVLMFFNQDDFVRKFGNVPVTKKAITLFIFTYISTLAVFFLVVGSELAASGG